MSAVTAHERMRLSAEARDQDMTAQDNAHNAPVALTGSAQPSQTPGAVSQVGNAVSGGVAAASALQEPGA